LGAAYPGPPARIMQGEVYDTLLAEGTVVEGGRIRRSVLGRGVHIEPDVEIEESVIMDFTVVRRGCRLRRVIVDRYNVLGSNTVIGEDPEEDARRYHWDRSGLVVLPRGPTRARF